MEWFTRMILNLPPRAKDVKELRDSAPELFTDEEIKENISYHQRYIHPLYWDIYELREAVRVWLQDFEGQTPEGDYCDHPCCIIRKMARDNADGYMHMMTVAGGRDRNPPAKSFFDLINATKIKNATVLRVILTDPYIYFDIGQNGDGGGFNNLLKLLEHLNINSSTEFRLELTPQSDSETKDRFEREIQQKFPQCTVSNHNNSSSFHDRFIFVQYSNNQCKAWYGPSLNGLNSNSIIIFGDLTDSNAVRQLSQRLL
ncbi:TPA: hypothetical protein ACGQSU_002954 [Raoultella planticola]